MDEKQLRHALSNNFRNRVKSFIKDRSRVILDAETEIYEKASEAIRDTPIMGYYEEPSLVALTIRKYFSPLTLLTHAHEVWLQSSKDIEDAYRFTLEYCDNQELAFGMVLADFYEEPAIDTLGDVVHMLKGDYEPQSAAINAVIKSVYHSPEFYTHSATLATGALFGAKMALDCLQDEQSIYFAQYVAPQLKLDRHDFMAEFFRYDVHKTFTYEEEHARR